MFGFFLLDCKPTIYYFAMKVLVIEDDQDLREIITRSLEKERYVVETAANYRTARQKALGYEYDCLLLDIMLPDGNGLDLLRVLREKERKFNVIILSAKDSIEDKVNGLDLGADDYLAKPFHLAELHARLKSVLRRRQRDGATSIKVGNVTVYPESFKVCVGDKALEIGRKEYDILLYFMNRPERLVEKHTLAEAVWGDYIDQADNFDFIYLITGGGPAGSTQTVPVYAYDMGWGTKLLGKSSAVTVLLFLFLMAVCIVYFTVISHWEKEDRK